MGTAKREDLEAALSARIEAIFQRSPGLHGFSVGERLVADESKEGPREWELYVCSVAASPELGPQQAQGFIGEIAGALAELLQQRPQAADLLNGRTFARAWH